MHSQKQVQHLRIAAEGAPGRPWRRGWEALSAAVRTGTVTVTGSTGLEAAETGQVKISACTQRLAPGCPLNVFPVCVCDDIHLNADVSSSHC